MRVARGVMKKEGLVTAIFHSKDAASKAFDELIRKRYDAEDLIIIMSRDTYRSQFQGSSGDSKNHKGGSLENITNYTRRHGTLRELPETGLVASGAFLSDPTL